MNGPNEALLKLVPEPSEDPRSAEFQAAATRAASDLKAAGVKYSQRGMAFDAVGVPGYPLAEYTIEFTKAVAPIVAAICSVIIAWLETRPQGKARFGNGDKFVEFDRGTDPELVERLVREVADKGRPEI